MILVLRIIVIFLLGLKAYSLFNATHSISYEKHGYSWEEYDPFLAKRLQSVTQILSYTDSLNSFKPRNNLQYCELLENVFRKRFYHGYSNYTYANNWLAAIAGKLVWNDLSAIVIPDHILKHPMAACSQQSIVLMECFKKIGIDYRKVGFTGHYALEGRINNKWFFFDPNREPEFINKRKSVSDLLLRNELASSYDHFPDSSNAKLLSPTYGSVNEVLTPNAAFFHKSTYVLSNLFVAIGVIFTLFPFINKTVKKKRQMIVNNIKGAFSSLEVITKEEEKLVINNKV